MDCIQLVQQIPGVVTITQMKPIIDAGMVLILYSRPLTKPVFLAYLKSTY
jgi:hypothetical protein